MNIIDYKYIKKINWIKKSVKLQLDFEKDLSQGGNNNASNRLHYKERKDILHRVW